MSNTSKSHSDLTSADDKSIGFEYQYYYFLLTLLNLRHNESIGLEVKDDVHLESANGKLTLIQLKHSIDLSSNITERSSDLWKTLYNWISIIQDNAEGRSTLNSQATFCKNTKFILISNKNITTRNKLVSLVREYKDGTCTYEDIKSRILTLKQDTEDKDITSYMDKALGLHDSVAEVFWNHVIFEFNCDSIIEKIKLRLKEKSIKENRINDVLFTLDGTLRQENYKYIKAGKKIHITFDDFYKRYITCFEIGQSSRLVIDRSEVKIQDAPSQLFIKQLIDIEDIEDSDIETIIEYSKYKYMAANNLARWLQNGDVTELDLQNFDNQAILKWKNIHKRIHRSISKSIKEGQDLTSLLSFMPELAQECLDGIRELDLRIKDQSLDTDISNGQFYLLSDQPKIGWLYNWDTKYGIS